MIENCLLRTGGGDTARDKRRRMERCVYANGWGAMETANEQRLLYFCWHQESPSPIFGRQRRLTCYIKLIPSYHICQHCNCEWPLPHKKTYEQVYYDIIKEDQIGKAGFRQEVTKILEWMMSRWTLAEEHIWLDQ